MGHPILVERTVPKETPDIDIEAEYLLSIEEKVIGLR